MAKSARASTRKRNNAILRAKVFGPAHDARTERLSTKLAELISKPKPEREAVMEIDNQGSADDIEDTITNGKVVDGEAALEHEMDLESQNNAASSKPKSRKGKIEKKKRKVHRKARNSIIFPSISRKRTGPGVVPQGKR